MTDTQRAEALAELATRLAELMTKGLINKEEARFRAVMKENF